ncbi:MAG: CPBP family intramembrane metalloprotease [Cytophagales bacterium]|nr:CPBP family intramembrane metalloprotease [Cytophagales bacterium]
MKLYSNDMKTEIISWRLILGYCGWIFLLSWGLQLLAIQMTTGLNDPAMPWWLAATMVSPGIVTSFYLYFNPVLRSALVWKLNRKVISATLLSVLVPILFGFIVVLILESSHWGTSTWFEFSSKHAIISGGPFLLGLGGQSWPIFLINVFITGFFFALLNGFIAAGEEIAWRGMLQGLLIERLGLLKGILLLGFVWSMWHLPIQLHGYNYPENPIVGSLIISPIIMIGYSCFMGWLTIHSKSFIPAAIAHGVGNGIQEGLISQLTLATPELYLYLIRLLTSLSIGLIFMYFLTRNKTNAYTYKRPAEFK